MAQQDQSHEDSCKPNTAEQCAQFMRALHEDMRRITQTLTNLDRIAAQQQAHNEHRDALLARLSRVVLEGNGVPSLVTRVDDLEYTAEQAVKHTAWVNDMKSKIIVALAVSFILGLTAFIGTIIRDHSVDQLSNQVQMLVDRENAQVKERDRFLQDYYADPDYDHPPPAAPTPSKEAAH